MDLPDENHRLRCARCGNLTRFDVVRASRVREFWHVSLSGEPSVDETEVLSAEVPSITCRWCGSADGIELVLRPEAGGPTGEELTGGTP